MQKICEQGVLTRLSEDLCRLLTDAGHYLTHEGIDRMGWQRKTTAFGNNLDGLPSTVDNNLARLALVKVLLQMGTQVRTGGVVDVVPEFGQEVSAAKHQFCPGE